MEDKELVEKRVFEILDFFKKEGIVDENLQLHFSIFRRTLFSSQDELININHFQLEEANKLGVPSDFITCQGDKKFLDNFNYIEIGFFHELGHYCDLRYRLNGNISNFVRDKEIGDDFLEPMDLVHKQLQNDDSMRLFLRKEAIKPYRMTPLEACADRNARMLMLYFLESL